MNRFSEVTSWSAFDPFLADPDAARDMRPKHVRQLRSSHSRSPYPSCCKTAQCYTSLKRLAEKESRSKTFTYTSPCIPILFSRGASSTSMCRSRFQQGTHWKD